MSHGEVSQKVFQLLHYCHWQNTKQHKTISFLHSLSTISRTTNNKKQDLPRCVKTPKVAIFRCAYCTIGSLKIPKLRTSDKHGKNNTKGIYISKNKRETWALRAPNSSRLLDFPATKRCLAALVATKDAKLTRLRNGVSNNWTTYIHFTKLNESFIQETVP